MKAVFHLAKHRQGISELGNSHCGTWKCVCLETPLKKKQSKTSENQIQGDASARRRFGVHSRSLFLLYLPGPSLTVVSTSADRFFFFILDRCLGFWGQLFQSQSRFTCESVSVGPTGLPPDPRLKIVNFSWVKRTPRLNRLNI